jgi:hypothetical protein
MQLNPKLLLRNSILDQLSENILTIKSYYASIDIAGFIRIEGGINRELFIADLSYEISPIQRIQFLPIPDEKKAAFIEIYSHLSPGILLVVLDRDANVDDRISDWFIV